jgi:hypothetical protein
VYKNKETLARYFGGETMAEIGKQFNSIDADGSGDLTWEEVKAAADAGAGTRCRGHRASEGKGSSGAKTYHFAFIDFQMMQSGSAGMEMVQVGC